MESTNTCKFSLAVEEGGQEERRCSKKKIPLSQKKIILSKRKMTFIIASHEAKGHVGKRLSTSWVKIIPLTNLRMLKHSFALSSEGDRDYELDL